MKGCLSAVCNRSLIERASTSVMPPAVNGTTSVTGRSGQAACALAAQTIEAAMTAPRMNDRMLNTISKCSWQSSIPAAAPHARRRPDCWNVCCYPSSARRPKPQTVSQGRGRLPAPPTQPDAACDGDCLRGFRRRRHVLHGALPAAFRDVEHDAFRGLVLDLVIDVRIGLLAAG